MFCSQCGKEVGSEVKFCASCGASVTGEGDPVRSGKSASSSTQTEEIVSVEVQGIAEDLSHANGDYETLTLGSVSLTELRALIQSCLDYRTPEAGSGEDFCPPAIFVTSAAGTFGFNVEQGIIQSLDLEDEVTLDQAVALVKGETTAASEAPASAKQSRKKKEGREKGSRAAISTAGSPQTAVKIWKSKVWHGFALAALIFGITTIFISMIVIGNGPRDRMAGIGLLLFGVGLIFANFMMREAGRQLLRLGVDRSSDTLWFSRNGVVSGVASASSIQSLMADGFVGDDNTDGDFWMRVSYPGGRVEQFRLEPNLQSIGEYKPVVGACRAMLQGGR